MLDRLENLLGSFLVWRVKYIPHRTFIIFLSVVVGLISGLGAVTLKNSTHIVQEFVSSGTFSDYYNPYYFVFPVIGIAISVVIVKILRHPVGEGIPSTLYAISKRNGILRPYKMYASLITSMFTVGFGGSVGLEGPTVSTGSAIGSNLGRIMHLNYKSRILLISCATAGAMASIFNAPIAAIIFTIEIFSLDLTLASLIPLLLASVSGAVTSIFIFGNDQLFHFPIQEGFAVKELPFYIVLGVLTAFASIYFTKVFNYVDQQFERMRKSTYRVIFGGLMIGMLIFFVPPLYGEGYETVNNLLNGNYLAVLERSFLYSYADSAGLVLLLLFGLVMFKAFATSFTLAAGGVGGIFAPSLFIGCALGFVFALGFNQFEPGTLQESHFALAGMAGLMAGVLHAPLTAIFMIAEITGGYQLFIPLMLTSATAFLVSRGIMPHSIYTRQLAKRGELITHDKDQAILTLMRLEDVVESDFVEVKQDMKLRDLVQAFSKSRRNIFPVVDEDGALRGVLTLDDFKQLLFDQKLYDKISVSELMLAPPAVIERSERMDEVMQKFQTTGAWNLPVTQDGRYMGFISKSKLFSAYRRKLKEVSG
ncbi:MAG: chloride channel protein [Bacteroidota bacterium]|nr:chloride channel protein [Bacteroidota bacterium]MDX5449298.1 chloride channel protein [Bacteroidota bacterium]MDX5506637.1 chloride channel protein [Bacteroidota bacterium]